MVSKRKGARAAEAVAVKVVRAPGWLVIFFRINGLRREAVGLFFSRPKNKETISYLRESCEDTYLIGR